MAAVGDLAGKTAVIAGGAPDLVRQATKALSKSGARLLVAGEAAAPSARLARALTARGDAGAYLQAQRPSDADWARVAGHAVERFGRLDVLVWIDAPVQLEPLAATSLDGFRARAASNLKSAFLGLKHAVAAIRRNAPTDGTESLGSIIFSCPVSHGSSADLPGSDTTVQRGVRLLSKAAALELGPERIRVNTVLRGLEAQGGTQSLAPRIPLGRFAEPEDFASAVLFLASSRSKFMTGAELVVDGGWSIQ